MAGHLRSLFLTSSERSPLAAIVWTIALAALIAVLHRDAFFSRPSWGPDGHSALSLHLAVADAYCGRKGHISRQYDLAAAVSNDRRLLRTPIPEVLRSVAGSVDAYCSTATHAVLNNENSLMLTMAAAMKMKPQISPGGLGRVFGAMRLLLIGLFAYAILIAGGSVLIAAVAMWICGDVLDVLRHLQYTVYPFLAPALLGLAGLHIILARHARASGLRHWAVCIATGFLTAFFANIRSSHLPIYAMFFLTYSVLAARQVPSRRLWVAARSLVFFGAGYLLFTFLLIRPLVPAGAHTNYSYHAIAHPLVLGLAIPPSDLSRREGIVWNDEVGIVLARRMIPDAAYLGETYEKALFAYYWNLWKRYPWEMARLYAAKFEAAATGMLSVDEQEQGTPRTARALAAAGLPATGTWLMLFYVAAFLIGGITYERRGAILGLLASLLAFAAIAVLAEAAIIIPTFRLMYHAYLLIFTGLLAAALVQIAVDSGSALVQKHTSGHSQVAANH